jgi:hypothetical protein
VSTVLHVFRKGQVNKLREWRVRTPSTRSERQWTIPDFTDEQKPYNDTNGKGHNRTTGIQTNRYEEQPFKLHITIRGHFKGNRKETTQVSTHH